MADSQNSSPPAARANESWTHREILQQPDTLRATHEVLQAGRARIDAFLAPLLSQPSLRIILAGAGTSAFIGESLAPWISRLLKRCVEAVPTTDIVSAPHIFLRRDVPTLLVSFGRSGDSPESVAAVELAEEQVRSVHHLVITCNDAGQLAQRRHDNTHVIVLPQATHDRAFAMTSSFTAMMYAALAIFTGIAAMDSRNEAIASAVGEAIAASEGRVDSLVGGGFHRVVYLGSGVLKGLAREAALKLLELSDGALVTMFDSSMGLRHGPKTVLNERTLVVMFVSNDPLTRRYDLDLLSELRRDGACGGLIAIATEAVGPDTILIPSLNRAEDVDLLFPFIVPAQLLALHMSLALGLTPDSPNASGTVNRVVEGVRIHVA